MLLKIWDTFYLRAKACILCFDMVILIGEVGWRRSRMERGVCVCLYACVFECVCVLGEALSFLSPFTCSLYAGLFCTLGRCQCLVTLPSLMAFLCCTPTLSTPPHSTSLLNHLWLSSPSFPCPSSLFSLESPLCTMHFFLFPLINTQYSLLSTPHVIHIWLADKLWMLASHITSKISIVFVNGWSILHLASCSELPMLPLSDHLHPWSPLPLFLFVYDFGLLGMPLVSKFHGWQLTKKTKHPIQVCTL